MKASLVRRSAAAATAVVLLVSQLQAVAIVPLPQPTGWNMFSPEQDIEVGKQNASEVRKQMPVLPDSNPVSQYVRQLGQKLQSTMPQPTWPYEFHVIQQKDVNAFACPVAQSS